MAPQTAAGETAAKVAAVAAGASAKDIERESTAARLLGAGMHGNADTTMPYEWSL